VFSSSIGAVIIFPFVSTAVMFALFVSLVVPPLSTPEEVPVSPPVLPPELELLVLMLAPSLDADALWVTVSATLW
jgi:hypothetical protein